MKHVKLAGISIVLTLMVTMLSGCASSQAEESRIRAVKTVALEQEEMGYSNSISGNIVPSETVKLSFKIDGVIEDVLVSEGQSVQKGDAVVKLKTEDYNLAVDAAKAQYESAKMSIERDIPQKLEQAKAQLDLTQLTYDRVKELYNESAIPKAQLDEVAAKLAVDESTYTQAQNAFEIANKQLGQAKAAYDNAMNNLSDTTLYSPIDGVVLKKVGSEGEVQGAGYPVVVLGSTDKVQAEFGVSDAQIGKFKLNQEIPIYVYGVEQEVVGTISEIGAVADEKTRLFTVRADVENKDGILKAGMIAKASLVSKEEEGILIPFLAVVHKADREVVFLYDESTETVVEREIQTGELIDDRIVVTSGLEAGERLVIEGQYQLQDGEKVTQND